MHVRNHADLPHFFNEPQDPRFLKPGLKSTQKSHLTLPTNPGLTIYKGSLRVDGSPDVVPFLKDPNSLIAATAAQNPYSMAEKAVRSAHTCQEGIPCASGGVFKRVLC